MIDLHCHLMPEVDDGATSLEISLKMLQEAEEANVSAICVTPHYSEINRQGYDYRFRQLIKQTSSQPVRLLRGMEYNYSDLLTVEDYLTLGGSQYILVDFVSPAINLKNVAAIVRDFDIEGYRIIAAHPERIFATGDLRSLARLAELGVTMQLNAGSFLGCHGSEAKEMADLMLLRGLCHVLASDSHGRPNRRMFIRDVRDYIGEQYGDDIVQLLLYSNSRRIIEGKQPERVIPKTGQNSLSRLCNLLRCRS